MKKKKQKSQKQYAYKMMVVFESQAEYERAVKMMLPGEKRTDFLKRKIFGGN